MHYVSLIIEFLRGRPAVVFWTAALTQAFLWTVIPALFYSGPPGEVPMLLAIGHEFVLGSYLGPRWPSGWGRPLSASPVRSASTRWRRPASSSPIGAYLRSGARSSARATRCSRCC
jgi:hypothetical protein